MNFAISHTYSAAYRLQHLKIFLHTEPETDFLKNTIGWQDGYDRFRFQHHPVGYRLTDPAPGLASVYSFRENGAALFFGHFKEDAPVNNDNGYQGLYFDAHGQVEKIAVIDAKQKLHLFEINHLPQKIDHLHAVVQDIRAPFSQTVLDILPEYLNKDSATVIRKLHRRYGKNVLA